MSDNGREIDTSPQGSDPISPDPRAPLSKNFAPNLTRHPPLSRAELNYKLQSKASKRAWATRRKKLETSPDLPAAPLGASVEPVSPANPVKRIRRPTKLDGTPNYQRVNIDKRRMPHKLGPKRRRFVQKLTDVSSPTYGNKSASAIAAGYRQRTSGQQLAANPIVSSEIARCLQLAGASREQVARTLRKGLRAKKTIAFLDVKRGEVVYSKPLTDTPSQLRAVELAGRFYGDISSGSKVEVHISITADRIAAARRRVSGEIIEVKAQDVVVEPPHNPPKQLSD